MNIKRVFRFSVLLSETFFILGRTERDVIKNAYWSSCKVNTRYSCHILMKFEFSGHIFEKYSLIKFHENPSSGSLVVHASRRKGDGHDEARGRFSQFCERALNGNDSVIVTVPADIHFNYNNRNRNNNTANLILFQYLPCCKYHPQTSLESTKQYNSKFARTLFKIKLQ